METETFILDHLRVGTLGLGPPFSALWALAPLLHFSLLYEYHALPILPRTAHRYLELKAHRMSLQHLETMPVEGKSCQIRWHKVFLYAARDHWMSRPSTCNNSHVSLHAMSTQFNTSVNTIPAAGQHVILMGCLPARCFGTSQDGAVFLPPVQRYGE